MRIWLDPQKLQARGLAPQDVIKAIQQQSQQVTAGQVGMPPAPAGQDFQYTVNVEGRLDRSGRVRQHHRQGRQRQWRPDHARQGRRPGRAGRADLLAVIQAERQAGRRHRHLPAADGQRAERGDAGQRQDGRAGEDLPPGPDLWRPVRHHAVRQGVDPRGLQDAARGRRAGADRDPGVPAGLARHAGAGDHRAGDHHRRLRRDGGAGLHRQPLHAVRHHPGDRHRGGRRDRDRGRRRAPYRARPDAARRRRSRRWTSCSGRSSASRWC